MASVGRSLELSYCYIFLVCIVLRSITWYCMIFHDPVNCIDTVEVILSDWRNTGTGTTQNLKTWLLSPPASWHDCTVRASCEFRDKERFVAFSLWGVVVNLWSTDHKMYFHQNACVCHRDEIFYWNVLSSGSLLLLVAFYTSSQIWWLLDPSRFTRFPQFGTYTPLETSLLRFQSHGWAASVEWGAEVGVRWLLQLRWRRRHNLAQLPPVSPSHQVTCHLRGRQVASQSHMLGWDWQTEMVSNSLWFFLEFVNSPQTFNKV